jgi:MoaA/NifB/PqqE/SkfB family radical SAM enzyme
MDAKPRASGSPAQRTRRALKPAVRWPATRVLLANPKMLKVRPSISLPLLRYLKKFRLRDVGGNLILHSHLPPLNGAAYGRFISEHLVGRSEGPSHAQVALTNACPQKCAYCYNRDRKGHPMETETILAVVRGLRELGVFWLGWTGGEPLLNRDIVAITAAAADGCAIKLFTTGSGLTPGLARDLKRAGLFSVSVSLDHWKEDIHDAARGSPGAFRTALRAIDIFRATDGLHVGVSAVLTRAMIRRGETEEFLEFLIGLGVDEAWLSEVKLVSEPLWNDEARISEVERLSLAALQDRVNREGQITVNYLGHFEGREHFGCNAGRKMVYVDAFGDVSPCVFTPMTFGNILRRPLRDIVDEMRGAFRPSGSCFMNTNYRLFAERGAAALPLDREASAQLAGQAEIGPPGAFMAGLFGKNKHKEGARRIG